jgi:hypothetical protein
VAALQAARGARVVPLASVPEPKKVANTERNDTINYKPEAQATGLAPSDARSGSAARAAALAAAAAGVLAAAQW